MSTQSTRKPVTILLTVIVIDLIGFGVAIPVLPFLAKEQGADGTVVGLLLASYAAMQFFFAPLWGRLSDRIGRRPVILVTIAGTSGCLLLLGLSDSIALMFVARVLGGVFGANISVATAYIGDVTDPDERTRYMGLVGASFAVGFTLGPLIGGGLSVFGLGVPMLFASAMAAANLVFATSILAEPERHEHEVEVLSRREALGRSHLLRRLTLINFIFTFAVCQLEAMFALYMLERFDYTAFKITPILFLMAIVMMGIQGGGIKRLAKQFGEQRLLLAGVALMAVAFLAVPYPSSVGLLVVPLVISAVGRAISQPSMLSMVSLEATPDTRGVVMGVFQSAGSAARTIGPLIAGLLFDWHAGLPFWMAGAMMFIAVPFCLALPRTNASELAAESAS